MTDTVTADRWPLTRYANGASPNSVHAIATVRPGPVAASDGYAEPDE